MKLGWFICLYGGTTVTSQQDDNVANLNAQNLLITSMGPINNFVYDELREKPAKGIARSGTNKPELAKDLLNQKLVNVQEKIIDALKLCGPGKYPPTKKDDAVGIIAKSGGFRNENKRPPSQRPAALITGDTMGYQGLSVPDLTGQFHTAQDFGFDTDFGQIQGFGRLEPSFDPLNSPDLQAIPISGLHQVLEHGLFDPLGSRFHDSSSKKRRRRYAPGKKVTKGLIRKKVRMLNKSFEPMEEFIRSGYLDNCRASKIERIQGKIQRTKDRIEKVVTRQGANLLDKN